MPLQLRTSLLLLLLPALGCGGGPKVPVASVSGRVFRDNNPLANANVHFVPISEDKQNPVVDSWGETDGEGRFTLKTSDGREGAAVGNHHVEIYLIDRNQTERKDSRLNVIPPQYNSNTKLTCTVPEEGNKEAIFHITSR